MTPHIAIVGTGVAGLSAAWLLSKRCRVTLYESEDRIGGHSNTCVLETADGPVPIDTGFIVYNAPSYPNLVAWFAHLDIPTARSNMSFAVSMDDGDYEYSGTGFEGIFAQRKNLVSLRHWRMLGNIIRFFRQVREYKGAPDETLGAFLDRNGYNKAFIEDHILPMAGAIWSGPRESMRDFPMQSFARFFANHGLLQVKNRPEWRTVQGGSRVYVDKVVSQLNGDVSLGRPVRSITRRSEHVIIRDHEGQEDTFDGVVIASHGDQALAMLTEPSEAEHRLLGKFLYSDNTAYLHRDQNQMPRARGAWSSWNYGARRGEREQVANVTYWMNRLQPLQTDTNYFVTLNPLKPIAPDLIEREYQYTHPIFSRAALEAQEQLWTIQGTNRTWFCGSYFGYGFHEDALQSGLAVAEDICGAARPWHVANASARIHRGPARPLHGTSTATERAA